MVAKKADTIEFEFRENVYTASKSELESYETNKQISIGGPAMYLAIERIFGGRDIEYGKMAGGSFEDMLALVNAAFAAVPKAKN